MSVENNKDDELCEIINWKTHSAGYRYGWSPRNKKMVYEHRVIWEAHNGPAPPGTIIHHKDGDPSNNNVDNLELQTQKEHIRKYYGFEYIGGTWFKPCAQCGNTKDINSYYARSNGGVVAKCKSCECENAKAKRERETPRERTERLQYMKEWRRRNKRE